MKKQLILFAILTLLLCGCSSRPQTAATEENIGTVPTSSTVYTEPADNDTTISTVTVSTVDEFLSQLESNRAIILKGGTYDLSTAAKYGRSGSTAYHWEEVVEGYELVLCDAANLTIQAEEGEEVTILSQCSYANVLRLRYCENVVLAGLTLGHDTDIGFCSGGVVFMEKSDNIEVADCKLYGCGTLGIGAVECDNIHADRTEIYDCSDGALSFRRCYNVLFENGSIHDCDFYTLVQAYNSREVALINSEITNNRSEYGTLFFSNCPGVYLGGLRVEDNDCYQFFRHDICPATVEACRFRSDCRLWSEGTDPVDKDGNPLTLVKLVDMEQETVSWTPAPKPEPILVPSASSDGMIHITNVYELLAAIAPDTKIFLEPGTYNLTEVQDYGFGETNYYYWSSVFDGAELWIHDIDGLTLCAAEGVEIVTEPRYANVLAFSNCKNLTLSGLSIGHTKAQGECTGGVVRLWCCEDVSVDACELYGCGTVGISASSVFRADVVNTEIHDCTYCPVQMDNSADISFVGCGIHDNGSEEFDISYSKNITRDGQPMKSRND